MTWHFQSMLDSDSARIFFIFNEREQVLIGKQKDNLDGTAVPSPYMNCLRVLEAMSYERQQHEFLFLHVIKKF